MCCLQVKRLLPAILVLMLVSAGRAEDRGLAADPFHKPDRRPRGELATKAIEHGLAVLQRGAREYPAHQACFACHHQTLPLLAMKSAREAAVDVDETLFQEQRKFTRNSFLQRQDRLALGKHIGGQAATTSYGLWALALANDKPDELTEAMTTYLLSIQHTDGCWKPPSNRPPLEVSSVSCTVLSAVGIQRFAAESQQEQVAIAISRAKSWLATAPFEDQEDLNFALWGEVLLGGTEERKAEIRVVGQFELIFGFAG